ncbi:ankyrin repeats (3 copies) domain-containing protein [Ditylenchus destructor]|nr:ankyrin repeats (3 copies) domain-containing protein [Ditylenchus destructor]
MENSEAAEKLRSAASQGDLDTCRELLVQYPNIINERGPDKVTAIFHACFNGHLETVKLLVENGADIEKKCRDFRYKVHKITPLMAACRGQYCALVEYLLSVGAQVDARSKYQGLTALHDAANNGNGHIVEILLKAGAKQQRDVDGYSPLTLAAFGAYVHLFPMLMHDASAQEEWDAWKILGCNVNDLSSGLNAWRKAVSKEGINELIANGDIKVDIDWSNAEKRRMYEGYPKEATTLEEVDSLAENIDALDIQALLIIERTMGDSSPTTHTYLDIYAWRLCETGRWERATDFWHYKIHMLRNCYAPMSRHPTINMLRKPMKALKYIFDKKGE